MKMFWHGSKYISLWAWNSILSNFNDMVDMVAYIPLWHTHLSNFFPHIVMCVCERKELWKERQNTMKQIDGKSFKSSIWINRENRAGEVSSLQLARLSPMTWGWSTGFVLHSSLQAHRDACSSLLPSNTCRLTSRTYTKLPQESNGVKSTDMTTTTGAGG